MKLDENFLKAVSPTICRTWQAIGYDASEFVRNNAEAIEVTLDADRITFNAGPRLQDRQEAEAVQKLIREAYEEHGYHKVQKFFARKISLY